ncbi:MAG: sialidase family protein [Flavisolibacter sp.]
MRRLTTQLLLILTVIGTACYGQSRVPVFISGEEGHRSYRIPAIINLDNGDLLAFCEGRVNDAGDFGDINIVMKRSGDGGKSWSALETIVDAGTLQAGNPAPVVDRSDPAYPQGRVFLFYNTGNNHESEVRKGKGLRDVWYKTSTDNGVTWSEAVNITAQVHRPRMPEVNAGYNFKQDWRSYANTPGHAIQLKTGSFRGRVFVAANHSSGSPQPDFTDYAAHGFYTDDHGKSFHLSASVPLQGSNESTAAELSGGRVMLNSRNQKGDVRARIVSISNNGGADWDSTYFDKSLPDPVNEGSLLTLKYRKKKNVLVFCNAADPNRRDHLTLRISHNDGRHWDKSILIDESTDGNGDFTAYSDLVKVSRRKVGVLYERNNYRQMVFSVIKW